MKALKYILDYRHNMEKRDKLIAMTLPDFTFVNIFEDIKRNIPLEERIIILHTYSGGVVEIFDREKVCLNNEVLKCKFAYINPQGKKKHLIAGLHSRRILMEWEDKDLIKKKIIIPTAKWYCNYCTWKDKQQSNP